MCLYTSPADNKSYHDALGEGFDYSAMKAEMTSALTDGVSDTWFKFDMSWLEWPDVELPLIFDFSDGIWLYLIVTPLLLVNFSFRSLKR